LPGERGDPSPEDNPLWIILVAAIIAVMVLIALAAIHAIRAFYDAEFRP
jgi:hypothetical protein